MRHFSILFSLLLFSCLCLSGRSLHADGAPHWFNGSAKPFVNYSGIPTEWEVIQQGKYEPYLVATGLQGGDIVKVTSIGGVVRVTIPIGRPNSGVAYDCLWGKNPEIPWYAPIVQFTDEQLNVIKPHPAYEVGSSRSVLLKTLMQQEVPVPAGATRLYASWPGETANKKYYGTCDFGIKIVEKPNTPPVCKIDNGNLSKSCSGAVTSFPVSALTSYDPDGDDLSYSWSTTCQGTLSPTTGKQTTFSTSAPASGSSLSCSIKLSVSDGEYSDSCYASVYVSACERDCKGVINGTATYDRCGVCGGDGTSCLDCKGVPNGHATYDMCGVCGGNDECLDCRGVPYGNTTYDQCGICGGTNECLDCNGVPNGGATIDICGVCDGDNSTCLDCDNKPYGMGKVDMCGVCNGTNECLDCAGIPNGDTERDVCGVCGGDGSSCEECDTLSIQERQTTVDHTLNALLDTTKRAARKLQRKSSLVRHSRFAERAATEAAELTRQGWQSVFALPPILTYCNDGSGSCSETAILSANVESVRNSAQGIERLTNALIRRLRKITGKRRAGRKLTNRATEQLSLVESDLQQVTALQIANCTQ